MAQHTVICRNPAIYFSFVLCFLTGASIAYADPAGDKKPPPAPPMSNVIAGIQQQIDKDNQEIQGLSGDLVQLGNMQAAEQKDFKDQQTNLNQLISLEQAAMSKVNDDSNQWNAQCASAAMTVGSAQWNDCEYRKGNLMTERDKFGRDDKQWTAQAMQIKSQLDADNNKLQQQSNEVTQKSQRKNDLQNDVERLQLKLKSLQAKVDSCQKGKPEAAKHCSNMPFDGDRSDLPPCTTDACLQWDAKHGVPAPQTPPHSL